MLFLGARSRALGYMIRYPTPLDVSELTRGPETWHQEDLFYYMKMVWFP